MGQPEAISYIYKGIFISSFVFQDLLEEEVSQLGEF